MKTIKILILIITLGLITNCGAGFPGIGDASGSGSAVQPSNDPVTETITDANGGVVASADQKLSLIFPAGSLPEDELDITVTPLESTGALGWDFQPDGLDLESDATARINFKPSEDFAFDESGVPVIIAVLESDDGSELEVVDNIKVSANGDTGTYTIEVPVPHFTKLYVTSGLGSYLKVTKTAGGNDAPYIDELVGDSDTNAMNVSFKKNVFAEALYPDGKKIRSEVVSSEVTAITLTDNGPTTSTVDLVAPITFNNADSKDGTITTTCDAAGSGDVKVEVTFKQKIEVTATPGGLIDSRVVTKTVEQSFPTNCRAVVVPPAQPQICIQVNIIIGGCLNIGTTITITLDTETLELIIEGLADDTLIIEITEDELTGEATIELSGVGFLGLPHTLILHLQDGVLVGFSFFEEGGPGACEEEVLEEVENSTCE